MKFQSINEARRFLEEKRANLSPLTEEDLNAVKEFFTQEQLEDMSFFRINIEDCFRNKIKP